MLVFLSIALLSRNVNGGVEKYVLTNMNDLSTKKVAPKFSYAGEGMTTTSRESSCAVCGERIATPSVRTSRVVIKGTDGMLKVYHARCVPLAEMKEDM